MPFLTTCATAELLEKPTQEEIDCWAVEHELFEVDMSKQERERCYMVFSEVWFGECLSKVHQVCC